jgi:Xaa-Pro aminopeptidase
MTHSLSLLRKQFTAWGVDAVYIPHEDSYLNEYLPDKDEVLAWVSGFTGSAGLAIVTAKQAGLFVDSRYTIQAKQQIDPKSWASFLINDKRTEEWAKGK